MELIVDLVDVWAATIKDEPGALSHVLIGLSEAGADLNLAISRRTHGTPGTAVVYVTPLRGDREIEAADNMGFNVTSTLHSVRVEGPNSPGIAAEMSNKLAEAGINLRGFSGAVLGTQFIIYFAMDTTEDANKTVELLRSA